MIRKRTNWILFWMLLLFLTGCEQRLQTGYGRPTGAQYSTSVNGTRIFHRMITATGHDVDRYGKFSPRWERYNTVIWMPDSFQPPSDELIDHIETWLSQSDFRKLIYVARDYDATMAYWRALADRPASAEHDYRRDFHRATTEFLANTYDSNDGKCDWYDLAIHPYTVAQKLSGPLTDSIADDEFDVHYATLPKPGDVNTSGVFGEYDAAVLLSVDDQPMIYSLNKASLGDSEIIVVGNASFLLNLPLTNASNQELAESLIDVATENLYYGEPVLFIESKYDLPIFDRDVPEIQSQWSWITQKPLRYIVPHIFFCCLLFCFVYFPIFGRPRRPKQTKTSNFRDHIEAMGQLLKRSRSVEVTQAWIEEFKRRSSRK